MVEEMVFNLKYNRSENFEKKKNLKIMLIDNCQVLVYMACFPFFLKKELPAL